MSIGIFAVGKLKGYFVTQNNGYTNRFLALVTGEIENRYGEKEELITEIEVSEKLERDMNINAIASECSDKIVSVPMGINHRKGEKNGRAWSFVKYYLRADTPIKVIDKASEPKVKAA
ncbi:hypothetical protein TDB9533_00814 [Thalassocella blandensis]|nr:hypothetical protein TDB9533_00814 [Thalassocella blandensis]